MRLLAVLGLVLLVGSACDSDPAPVPHPPAVSGNVVLGPTNVASGTWTVDLRDGASTVHVALADLHGPLYRIATPAGVPAHPVAAVSGRTVAVNLVGGSTSLDIMLNRGTPWNVQLSSGASTLTVDASSGTLAGLATLAGVSTIDITAGAPRGLRTIREVGGTSSLDLHVPAGTGVQVAADGGAGTISLFGVSHQGISAGQTFTTPGFGGDGYRIEAEAGVSSVVVDAPDHVAGRAFAPPIHAKSAGSRG